MVSDGKVHWSLAELAEESGLSARTIRYYISRGLLSGPEVAGRGAVYGEHHLARLQRIRELQSRGAMLSEIMRLLEGKPAQDLLPAPESWERYPLNGDVMIWLRADVAPWRSRQIRRALGEFAAKIRREKLDEDDHGKP